MVDRRGLRLIGFIFASVTFVVMLTTTMVVKGYSDGLYSLESAAIEGTCICEILSFLDGVVACGKAGLGIPSVQSQLRGICDHVES